MPSLPLFPAGSGRFAPMRRPGNCLPDCVILPAVTANAHKHAAPSGAAIRIAVITVSDTRTEATDEGGRLIAELCAAAGAYQVVSRAIVRDEPAEVAGGCRRGRRRGRTSTPCC